MRGRIVKFCWATTLVLCGTSLLYFHGTKYSKPSIPSKNNSTVFRRLFVKADFNMFPNRSSDVILSAYMNSGSRFTGRLLGFRSDSFYFYEPLWKFSTWNYYKPPNICCSSTNGNCSNTTTEQMNRYQPFPEAPKMEEIVPQFSKFAQPHDLLLYVLASVYTCNFESIKNTIQLRVHDHLSYSGPSWNYFRECIQKFRSKTECLRGLQNVCRNKTVRVAKVIRLTVGAFEPLLEINTRLKLVHLVRDPRGIIQSRLFSRGYPVYGYWEKDSLEKNLCNKMFQDIQDLVYLRKKFPDRIFILYYEDLLSNLHVRLKQLYKHLNINFSESEINDLSKIQVNILPPEKPFHKIQQDRIADNAQWWRKHMAWYDVNRVQTACGKVLQILGYRKIENESELRDRNYSSLTIPKQFQI